MHPHNDDALVEAVAAGTLSPEDGMMTAARTTAPAAAARASAAADYDGDYMFEWLARAALGAAAALMGRAPDRHKLD